MKFISLFSGIGGFDFGAMLAGHECVGYVEIDKYAHQAFQILHDPDRRLWNAYDIRSVSDESIREFGKRNGGGGIQLIVGGFPCQSFSIAGKRQGFADTTRGTLFFEIVRFASILRPQYLLLENVEGLLNHEDGNTFEIVLSTLDEVGYDCEWQVLNSAAWVPQNRERTYIEASLRGRSTRKVFPFGRENGKSIEVVGRIEAKGDDYIRRVYGVDGLSPCLPAMQGGGQEPKILVAGQIDSDSGGTGKVYDPSGIAPTQLAQHGNAVAKVVVEPRPTQFSVDGDGIAYCLDTGYAKGISHTAWEKGRRTHVIQRQFAGKYSVNEDITGTLQDSRVDKVPMVVEPRNEIIFYADSGQGRQIEERRIAPPLRAQGGGNTPGIWANDGYRIRKLTPLECFRLQSYPDEWYIILKLFNNLEFIQKIDKDSNDITAQIVELIDSGEIKEGISDSQLYKMAGNGVTSIVAYEIARRLEDVSQ